MVPSYVVPLLLIALKPPKNTVVVYPISACFTCFKNITHICLEHNTILFPGHIPAGVLLRNAIGQEPGEAFPNKSDVPAVSWLTHHRRPGNHCGTVLCSNTVLILYQYPPLSHHILMQKHRLFRCSTYIV